MRGSKLHERIELVAYGPFGPVLYVVGTEVALSPFLERLRGKAEDGRGSKFIEDGIVIEGRERWLLQGQVSPGKFGALGGAGRMKFRLGWKLALGRY